MRATYGGPRSARTQDDQNGGRDVYPRSANSSEEAMKPDRGLDASRPAEELRHYVYLTDGRRAVLLRQVTWHGDDIYLTDPNDPNAGKVSWHESGRLNLGQPLYDPKKVVLAFPPPSGVHGYASPL